MKVGIVSSFWNFLYEIIVLLRELRRRRKKIEARTGGKLHKLDLRYGAAIMWLNQSTVFFFAPTHLLSPV
jgi:hypothetical protein